MNRVAFIGLGIMGKPMALNLVRAGYDVVCYDRHESAMATVAASGGERAENVASCVRGADVIITMVQDSSDVLDLCSGDAGVYANAMTGSIHIDCSTIRPDVARQLAVAGAHVGVEVLDAPVSGGEVGAIAGSLSIMVGGNDNAFHRVQEVLDVLGETVVKVGTAGCGQTVKAANQLIVAGHIELLAEAIVFLQAHEVDMSGALAVLGGGLAGSTVLRTKGANMLDRRFEPGFRIDLHHKDLGIVSSAAREAGVSIPLGAHVASLVASWRARGNGHLDHSSLFLSVEEASGRTPVMPAPAL